MGPVHLDMAVYRMVMTAVGFLSILILLAAPFYAPVRFFRSISREVRRNALFLMGAWLCAAVLLFFYVRSGIWYEEHSMSRHVNVKDLLEAAGFLIFGVVLPGIPLTRLLALRK